MYMNASRLRSNFACFDVQVLFLALMTNHSPMGDSYQAKNLCLVREKSTFGQAGLRAGRTQSKDLQIFLTVSK
jgi:hypothetical protein